MPQFCLLPSSDTCCTVLKVLVTGIQSDLFGLSFHVDFRLKDFVVNIL